MIRIGIDVGGTFTDLVAADEATGEARHFKLPSTPSDPAAAIAEAVGKFDAACGDVDPGDCRSNAERFSAQRFRLEFVEFAQRAWREFGVPAR